MRLLKPDGRIVALVKPQFEAGKAEADKGRGVITDPAVHATGAGANCKNLLARRLVFAGGMWLNPPCLARLVTKNSSR